MKLVCIALALTACGGAARGADPDPDAAVARADAPPGAVIDSAVATAPDWSTELPAADLGLFDVRGTATLGVADAMSGDDAVARLILAGDPALGPADHASPAFASELATQRTFTYGTFRTRVRLASCAPGEEAVNGLFTFYNDGGDRNHDGLSDNDEIDIEILCGTPSVVFLSSWTDYQDSTGAFRKLTRAVDLADGSISESISDHEYDLAPKGKDAALAHPGLLTAGGYVELGWTWHADALRFFVVDGGQEVTLWDLHDAAHLPVHEMSWMWNVWHAPAHWTDNKSADFPSHDAVLQVDWARYWRAP
jgi:hypothetical protein